MASNNVLTPNDVPGAVLKHKIVNNNNITELKRWLACRGLRNTGSKVELVTRFHLQQNKTNILRSYNLFSRVENCITNRKDNFISLSIDGGIWYEKKFPKNIVTNPVPKSGWKKFPSISIPTSFSFVKIHEFVIRIICTCSS